MISFRVEGEPIGKGRPRVTARGGKFAHAYTPKKTKDYEDKDVSSNKVLPHQ